MVGEEREITSEELSILYPDRYIFIQFDFN